MEKPRENAKSAFRKSLVANIVNTSLTTFTGIFIPKYLGAAQYGYWQVLALYLTYVPFFHFGSVDGVYLRQGGKKWEELDHDDMHTQFWMNVLYDAVLSCIFLLAAYLFADGNHEKILLVLALECVIWLPRLFFQYLLQAAGRVSVYARNLKIERIVVASAQVVCLIGGIHTFLAMGLCDVLGKTVGVIQLYPSVKSIVKGRGVGLRRGLSEMKENYRVGFKITFSTISGMLLIGIEQFTIETNWPIDAFGRVSFALVALTCSIQFINQVSVVIYPLLKQNPRESYPGIFGAVGCYPTVICATAMIWYGPLRILLDLILPDYSQSIIWLSYLVPVLFFEGRTTPILNSVLKAMRKEGALLWINVGMMILAFFSSLVTVYAIHSLTAVVFSILGLLIFRSVVTEIVVQKTLGTRIWRDMTLNLLLCAACLAGYGIIPVLWKGAAWEGLLLGWAVYIVAALFVRRVEREPYEEAYRLIHGHAKRRKKA